MPQGRREVHEHMAETGTVKFFNGAKGFGFITPDSGGTDVFVHISAVERSGLSGLVDGQKVEFDTEPDPRGKGPKAVNIKVTGEAPEGAARPPRRDFGDRPPRRDFGDRPPRREGGFGGGGGYGDRGPRREGGGGYGGGGGGGYGDRGPRREGGGFGGGGGYGDRGPRREGGGGFGGGGGGRFEPPAPSSDFGDRPQRKHRDDKKRHDSDDDDWS